ncbi:hypothetical protein FRX31_019476, partial [Thalictrum thalictroides]
MVGMDVLTETRCHHQKEHVLVLAARASRVEYQDAIDAAMVGMLTDDKENTTLASRVEYQDAIDAAMVGMLTDDKENTTLNDMAIDKNNAKVSKEASNKENTT